MELMIKPRGILEINNARICYRNFAGGPDKFNPRGGKRSFSLVIDGGLFDDGRNAAVELSANEMAEELVARGWNVKVSPARDETEDDFITLPVKITFNERGPVIMLKSRGNQRRLFEDNMKTLDEISISNVDMDIRPYDWDTNGKTGRTAYLQGMAVTQEINRFEEYYAEVESPEEY